MDAYLEIDWVTKHQIIKGYLERHPDELQKPGELDLKYHFINPKRGIFRGRREKNERPFTIDRDRINYLVTSPPENEERASKQRKIY